MARSLGRLALISSVIAVMTLLAASLAWAAQKSGSGELQITSAEVTSQREAGPNDITTIRYEVTFTGTLAGDAVAYERDVTHPNGVTTFRGEVTCDCTIDGRSGTAVTQYSGKTQNGTLSGRYTIKGSGGLDGLRGHGTFEGAVETGHGTYTIQYTWA